MALTQKIFYTFIFSTNDFQTQTQREREREGERERQRETERKETRESEPAAPLSSNHHPKPRRTNELAPVRSSCEIAP